MEYAWYIVCLRLVTAKVFHTTQQDELALVRGKLFSQARTNEFALAMPSTFYGRAWMFFAKWMFVSSTIALQLALSFIDIPCETCNIGTERFL